MKPWIVCLFVTVIGPALVLAGGSGESEEGGGSSMMMAAENPLDEEGGSMMMAADIVRGPIVLFFSADWCPTCRATLKDIEANQHRLGDIEVIIVDYDRAADLKAKYRVAYQHTFVQVDPEGSEIATWNGGGVDTILSRVVRKE